MSSSMAIRFRASLIPLLFIFTAGTTNGREPTAAEQLQLELINRARANPNAEVARLSGLPWGETGTATPDLNEGLPAGTITSDPKQPLAFDLNLIDAASDYTDLLLADSAFSHTWSGTNPQGRMTAAGYTYTPSFGLAENLALSISSTTHVVDATTATNHHNGLFIDDDDAGRGHRITIMNNSFRQIGIGMGDATMTTYDPCCPNAVLTTQDYAFSAAFPGPFLTGVVYDDLDMNMFYSIGEGLGFVQVDVLQSGTENEVASTTTYGSGGYSLPVSANTTYDVRFAGPGFSQTFMGVNVGTANVKLDGINLVPEPSSLLLLLLGSLGLMRRR